MNKTLQFPSRNILASIRALTREPKSPNALVRQRRERDLLGLQDVAAKKFAEINGWRRMRNGFRVEDIGGERTGYFDNTVSRAFDHPLFFRKAGDCIALVVQPYNYFQDQHAAELEALAERLGLVVRLPPHHLASIHNPDGCAFVAISEPDTNVKWLGEQATGLLAEELVDS